jgi:hypothetical protein
LFLFFGENIMAMATVNLDATWFSGNSGPPWVLPSGNTEYILQQDVVATGNFGGGDLFKFTAPNTELVLNGHLIYYNGYLKHQHLNSGLSSVNTERANLTNPIDLLNRDETVEGQSGTSSTPP